MADNLLVFYGSYRSDRVGIRMATFAVKELRARGAAAELVDARAVGLPIIDRMYKEYPAGSAPPAMEDLAKKIRTADAFVFVVGEYNFGPQPGLKNLTDHFLEEWYWRPAAVVSYSPGRLSGARASSAWHPILSEMGMIVISSTVAVGPIAATFDEQGEPIGEPGRLTKGAFRRVADDLAWWTSAARLQRLRQAPPY
jgi:NAD(P)H-dependent FMN reductase